MSPLSRRVANLLVNEWADIGDTLSHVPERSIRTLLHIAVHDQKPETS
jgi:hypothetical protein